MAEYEEKYSLEEFLQGIPPESESLALHRDILDLIEASASNPPSPDPEFRMIARVRLLERMTIRTNRS